MLDYNIKPNFGGGRRIRTDDPLLARQVLSQLSYTPEIVLARPIIDLAKATSIGRSSGIRTHDLLLPRQARYQAALCSVIDGVP